jgi:lambda family phage minor tail protein L
LDATGIGGTKYYFTPATSAGTTIYFGGIQYNPVPVEFDGVEMTSSGQLARPKIRVANVNKDFLATVRQSNQLLGATITRRRTFEKYLDYGREPDNAAKFPEDVYVIERLTAMNKTVIEWELKSEIDLENVWLPKRQVLDLCSHVYRSYDGGFDYTNATCPYTGTNYYDLEDTACAAADDICSKKLNACQLRFGTNAQLPYRGFPGIGKIGYPYR